MGASPQRSREAEPLVTMLETCQLARSAQRQNPFSIFSTFHIPDGRSRTHWSGVFIKTETMWYFGMGLFDYWERMGRTGGTFMI